MSTGGALFGNAGSRSQSKNLVEFRAGKMTLRGRMVHPDKRKGLVYIYQSEDSLMHFCWKDRQKGTVEDDLIIFPDDVEYKHVPQCTTGRVYILKFKTNNRKMFFWMQEPKVEKDTEVARKLNDVLNNPPAPGSSHSTGGGGLSGLPAELASLSGETDLHSILGSMNQQQLMQLLSGMGGMRGMSSLMGDGSSSSLLSDSSSTVPSRVQSAHGTRSVSSTDSQVTQPERPATAAALPSQSTVSQRPSGGQEPTQIIRMEDFQSILSGLGAMETDMPKEVDLSQGIDSETLIPILANADVQHRLIPFLPDGEELPKTEEELRQTIHSPQFRQALHSFSAALASCQLGPLMAQFGLSDDAVNAAVLGDVAAFARALQNTSKDTTSSTDAEEPTKMDEDKP